MSNLNDLKIISGGQSGTDRAALDYALSHNIPCGGWCPAGRKAEDGIIPDKYPLRETASSDPSERTVLNVNSSDGLLIIWLSELDEGSRQTLDYAKKGKKPVYLAKQEDVLNPEEFRLWLDVNRIRLLNVAGPRESNDAGVYDYALRVLGSLLSKLKE
ncbi:MAG: putative molybdenum carrier protein [Bacteroidales bacterium]|jgi:hypothetical protein|nr:putative molybdenum carrier protein [Bacteroidales bacterium]